VSGLRALIRQDPASTAGGAKFRRKRPQGITITESLGDLATI